MAKVEQHEEREERITMEIVLPAATTSPTKNSTTSSTTTSNIAWVETREVMTNGKRFVP